MAIINFEMNYEPRVASFGPIHHGTPKCQLGEKYKLILTYEFIRGGGNDILKHYLLRPAQQNLGPMAKILYEAFLYININ